MSGRMSEREAGRRWADWLLCKFPSLDPEWSEAVKARWWQSFDKLMALRSGADR